MRRSRMVLGAAGATLALGLFGVGSAHADTIGSGCTPAGPTVAACGTIETTGGSGTVSSSGLPVGGAVGGSGDESGATVFGQGNTGNPPPSNGWVQVQVGPSGPTVTCDTTGYPGSTSDCSPSAP